MAGLIRSPAVSQADAKALVASTKWFHTFEIVDGLVTPGLQPRFDPGKYIDSLDIGQSLAGVKALDIGTYDGPMAFELAQRGAEVVAVDLRSPDSTGFNTVKKISGVNIRHVQADVCSLDKEFKEDFDIVLFLGVFYHVKNPIGAFESVARVIKPGGILHIEGESFERYFENTKGVPVNVDQTVVVLEALDEAGVPVCMAYPGTYVHGNNWFLPNRSALRGWIELCGLSVLELKVITTPLGSRRLIARAKKS
jgi:SAM-dependent methyltransferase